MNKSLFRLCAVLLGVCLVHTGFAEEGDTTQADKTICNKNFQVMSMDRDKKLGTYSIKAVMKESETKIEIVESWSLDYRGKQVDIKSTVVYENTSPFAPKKGTVETKIDGKTCMKGTVTFSEETVDFECKGFLDKRTGKALDPPKSFAKKNQPVAEGVLIFQSALLVIGPRILPKEGELKNVVFVEFPDDLGAPELINFKEGYRLVRGQPDEKGEYDMRLHGPHSDFHIRFSKDDRAISALYGKMKLVEVEEKKD